jgi:Sulfotransferase domain
VVVGLNASWGGFVRRSRSSLRRVEARARNPISRVNPEPVFLLGNQRSGTTAIAAILAGVTGATAALDLSREARSPTFDRVRSGQMSLDDHIRRNRFAFSRAIVKEPHLTPFYAELRDRFPRARFALVVRDPRDNLRSLFDYLELPGQGDYEVASRRIRARRSWQLVVDGRWLGITAGGRLQQLAERWNLCADVYLENPESVVLVRYEDFVADRRGITVSLARSLGLPLAGRDIAGRDAARAYQPRGTYRYQAPVDFFGPDSLHVIERICGERMVPLDYRLGHHGPLGRGRSGGRAAGR